MGSTEKRPPGKSRLLAAREGAGLSIQQASERLDWPSWLIESYESGCSVPPGICLRRLADTYGVSVAWLRAEIDTGKEVVP